MGVVVTGHLGFIGGRIAKRVDTNLLYDCKSKRDLLDWLKTGKRLPEVIFHQGAYSSTTFSDVQSILENNYYYSCSLLDLCIKHNIRLIYASSASVYGKSNTFVEGENENPDTPYAYSKLLFDNYVRQSGYERVTGLRYFNVYGPGEEMKGNMASMIHQLPKTRKLFKYGEHKRDFIHVDDVVDVNLWFAQNEIGGIFNVGTGQARSFNEVAEIMGVTPEYIDNPYSHFQGYTCADITKLRKAGYEGRFTQIEDGILNWESSVA